MKILAGCIVRLTEVFLHPGYSSAWSPPHYPQARLRYAPLPEPHPLREAGAALGSGADHIVSEGMTGAIGASSDAIASSTAGHGFYLDMYAGADRWSTLLIGVLLFFITAAVIAVMRGRRLALRHDEDELEEPEVLEALPSEGG